MLSKIVPISSRQSKKFCSLQTFAMHARSFGAVLLTTSAIKHEHKHLDKLLS